MITLINGEFGSIERYTYPKNQDIVAELRKLDKTFSEAQTIVSQLQNIRIKYNFFGSEFKGNYNMKILFFSDCLSILRNNKLPLHTASIRDSFILILLKPFFTNLRNERLGFLKIKRKCDVQNSTLQGIWELINAYEVPVNFIKFLFGLHDSDLDGGLFDTILLFAFKYHKPL